MPHSVARPLAGFITIAVTVGIVFAADMFRGGFTETVPVTVVSPRAGLVMNPDAKVTDARRRGGQGRLDRRAAQRASRPAPGDGSVADAPHSGQCARRHRVDDGVRRQVRRSWCRPPNRRRSRCTPVRCSTPSTSPSRSTRCSSNSRRCCRRSTPPSSTRPSVRSRSALNGRGHKIGQTLGDLDSFLATLDPSLPALSHDIAVPPDVFNAYADAAPDLVKTVDNTTRISKTIVDEQHNLDAFLISAIGLADIGNDVVGANRQALTDVLHLLVPTTDLLQRVPPALTCAARRALVPLATSPPTVPEPMIKVSVSLALRRRTLPVPARPAQGRGDGRSAVPGPSQGAIRRRAAVRRRRRRCQPHGSTETRALLLNSDALKQLLYGPIDGPPRNTAQIGQPG